MKEQEAEYYKLLKNGDIKCQLCPHNCNISAGKAGVCGVRRNIDSRLITEIYGLLTSLAMDPIEKKPLYHFYPGSQILSIGTRGCNLKCPYCQNWHISQDLSARASYYSPEELTDIAYNNDSAGIAYTYSEPMIWFEYVMDTAKVSRKKGLYNVMVTNGFINEEPLNDLVEYIDAMNIDLKSFKNETYKRINKGNLENIINTIQRVHDSNCHLEVTTLIVTGINDNLDEMRNIVNFIASINSNIPWHISRYHPGYQYSEPATDVSFMMKVYDEAVKKLNFVYCGNIASSYAGSDTVCPSCNTTVIKRTGYFTRVDALSSGKCTECGTDLGIKQ